MCVVALTLCIATCNIKLLNDLSAIDMNVTTERLLVARVHEQKSIGECVCTT